MCRVDVPDNPALTLGLVVLLSPSLGACAASGEPLAPDAPEAELDQEAGDDASSSRCLEAQLPRDASFEVGEPEDYDWQESGLGIFDRVEGDGAQVQEGDQVTIAYTAYLLDGCAFDSTLLREPITMPLEGVIPGMREGLIGMRVGGLRRLYIPPELAYGSAGAGEVIGPDEALVFEVELLELP